MSNVLFVCSSPRGNSSVSLTVGNVLVERLAAKIGSSIVTRDLSAQPLPHINEDFVVAIMNAPDQRSVDQQAAVDLSDALIKEVRDADVIVVSASMINFGIPSTLKSWIDYITRSGLTFRYSANGYPEGLISGKKVYLVETRGGIYSQDPQQSMDFQHPYLVHVFGFLGMTDIETVLIEGTSLGPEKAQQAVQSALKEVEAIA